jgi:hypothetical protein
VLARRLFEEIDQLLRREATRQRLDRRSEKGEGGNREARAGETATISLEVDADAARMYASTSRARPAVA